MKMFYATRKAARTAKKADFSKSTTAKLVDSKEAPSINGSRWAIEVKRG